MLNFKIKTASYTPKNFSLDEIQKMNLPVFYVCNTPDFYWKPGINEEKFKNIMELKEDLPVVKCYLTLKNSDPEITFFSDNKTDLISQISDHFIAHFNFYIQSLEARLYKLKNTNYIMKTISEKLFKQETVENQIEKIQNDINQAEYFIKNKLTDLIKVDFHHLDNFVLPDNIEELFKTESVYILNINNENDTFKAGISQHTLSHKSIKYLLLFEDITKDKTAEITFSFPTEKTNTFDHVYITKNNREVYSVLSFKNGLFCYTKKEEAEEQLQLFIDELNKTLSK